MWGLWHVQGAIKVADIGHLYAELSVHIQWSERLEEEGVITNATIFRLGARYRGEDQALKFGEYEIPAEAVAREKAVIADSEDVKSKPADKHERIIAGKLEKFYAGLALVEQPWFKDDKQTVAKVLAAELGPKAAIEGFALFLVGA